MTVVERNDRGTGGQLRSQLAAFHEDSLAIPLLMFLIPFALWIGLFAIGLWTESVMVRAVLTIPLAVVSGQLFMIGHDAAHGSYTPLPSANAVVGRLALLPSMHVFGLWRDHHNTHHRFTNLKGRDFVWEPPSPDEYWALPRWRRGLERFYRNPLGIGLGVHYALEIWIPRMLYPRRVHQLSEGGNHQRDVGVFSMMIAITGVASYWFATEVDPSRSTSLSYWTSVLLLMLVLPLAGTQWLIGFVIFFNHTHPDIRWFDDFQEWSSHDVQIQGSAGQRFSKLSVTPLPRRILNHTAHHVDPGIPLRRLKEAQRRLTARHPDLVVSYDPSIRTLREILSRCKLYDYNSMRWTTYDESSGPE